MPLGMEVGLDISNIVLDGDPAHPPPKVHSPQIFILCLLWPNGWMDQVATWYVGRPRPWPHCVRWEPTALPQRGNPHLIFGQCLLWPNGWMDQDATWYTVGVDSGDIVLDGPISPPSGKGHSGPPLFGPCLLWPNDRPSQLLLSSCLILQIWTPRNL